MKAKDIEVSEGQEIIVAFAVSGREVKRLLAHFFFGNNGAPGA